METVTAQLVYEIQSPRYAGPDVTARFDTLSLTSDGDDRVRISGVRGEPPYRLLAGLAYAFWLGVRAGVHVRRV